MHLPQNGHRMRTVGVSITTIMTTARMATEETITTTTEATDIEAGEISIAIVNGQEIRSSKTRGTTKIDSTMVIVEVGSETRTAVTSTIDAHSITIATQTTEVILAVGTLVTTPTTMTRMSR